MKQLYSVLAFCGLYIVSDNEEASFLRGNLEEKRMVEVQRKHILFVRSLEHFVPCELKSYLALQCGLV